jgi:CIC family chloride channel protein
MLVSSISFAIAKRYDKYSMDIYSIADKGIVFTTDKDQNILNRIEVSLIYKSFIKTISPKASLDDVRDIIKSTAQDFIPVVDEKRKVHGVITLDSLRKILFENHFVYAGIENYISEVLQFSIHENASKMLDEMDANKADYALMEKNGKFEGYITKTMILEVYRLKLKNLRIE